MVYHLGSFPQNTVIRCCVNVGVSARRCSVKKTKTANKKLSRKNKKQKTQSIEK